MFFTCGEIHVFIGHRLQQTLEVLLCLLVYPAIVLFCVWQCAIQTKAKLDDFNVQVPHRLQTSAKCGWEPFSSLLCKLGHWP